MITVYTLFSWLYLFGYWLLIAGVTLRIMMKRRTVPSAMAWLLVIYILPLLGICAYLLLGELNLGRRRAERARALWPYVAKWFRELNQCDTILATEVSQVAQPLMQLCEQRNGVRAIKGNHLQLFTNTPDSLSSIVRDIEQAQESIEMVFYIWNPGGLVDQLAEKLMEATCRGVRCRLMLDSVGSRAFFRSHYPRQMRNTGIEVVEALQVHPFRAFLRRMDLRQHRKIALIDNKIAYTGSMNMVDPRYFRQSVGVGQWIDLMVRMQGPIACMMAALYSYDWEMETDERTLPELPNPHQLLFADEPGHILQLIASGPGFPEDLIHQALLTAIYSARKQLTMTTPYFVPSDDLLHAICTAAMRGVDVTLILPEKNDSLMVGWASRSFFSELLQAGVKIYQFSGGLLHTKSVLVDHQLCLLGTVNLDMRSLWLNFEDTVVIDDPTCSQELAAIQESYIAQSSLLSQHRWKRRPFWQRLVERLFFFFSPLL